MILKYFVLSAFVLLTACGIASAQDSLSQDTSDIALILIDRADLLRETKINDTLSLRILNGNVELHQDSLLMYCDSAVTYNNQLEAYRNVILQQWDSIAVFADTLYYDGNAEQAQIIGDVVLQSDDRKMATDRLDYDVEQRIATYNTGARIVNDSVRMYSIKGIYNIASKQIFFKDSVYIESQDFQLYADSLDYDTESEVAYFVGPTLIVLQGTDQIYCEGGYYSVRNQTALFVEEAEFTGDEQNATADSIFYFGDRDLIILKDSARLISRDGNATANTIIYQQETELLQMFGDAVFEDSARYIVSDTMSYNLQTETFETQTRSTILQESQRITAEKFFYVDSLDIGQARGDIIWVDTSADYTILTDSLDYSDSLGFVKAYGNRPLFISLIDQDSLFLSSDTLFFIDQDSVDKINGYYRVKIYKSDLQAICDSMAFDSQDSSFHLFGNPIIWSDTSQFTADTIIIELGQDNEIKRIDLIQNAMIINSADEILFNQMRGRIINAYFADGEIDYMMLLGNAESYYYASDDAGDYIGLNETRCSRMKIGFNQGKVDQIYFYDQPKSTLHPIQSINPEDFKFDNFRWLTEERPKSKHDLQ